MEKIKERKEIPDVHNEARPAPVSGRWSFVSPFLLKPLGAATVPRKQRGRAREFSEALWSRIPTRHPPHRHSGGVSPSPGRGVAASTRHLQAELVFLARKCGKIQNLPVFHVFI